MNKQELLRKYWNGKCSPAELRQLYQYLQEDEAADYEPLLSQLWHQISETQPLVPTDSNRIYQAVVANTQGLEPTRSLPRPLMVAAVVSALLVVGWLARMLLFPAYTTYQTAYGEVRQIVLPDSTVVDLNANSQLKVLTDPFAAPSATRPREVWLTGEAYFHVKPQPSATGPVRFVVHTSDLDVEVLGTTFDVKDRRGATDVVLNTGRVLLRQQTDSTRTLAMEPGDKVRLTPQQEFVLTQVPEPAAYASWKDHELYFDDQPLAAIQQELADGYDIHLRFGNPALADLRFTGSAPADNINILLETIQKSFDLTLKSDRDGYLLTP